MKSKYSQEERQIALKISKLKTLQKHYRNKYLELDVKIQALKHKLKGKYKDWENFVITNENQHI
jgi:hypothetical protein